MTNKIFYQENKLVDNKIIVISGGTDGLGKALAKLLAPTNTVIILSPDDEKLVSVSQAINCSSAKCDVTNPTEIEETANLILKKYGRVDTIINCAGIWTEGPLESNDPEKIAAVFKVNALGTILLTRAFVPHLKQQGSGQIVNIISMAGLNEKPDRSVYYASKWAITGFTKCLRLELEPFGIQVLGCYPGKMKTNMFSKAGFEKDLNTAQDPQVVAQKIVENLSQKLPTNDLELDSR